MAYRIPYSGAVILTRTAMLPFGHVNSNEVILLYNSHSIIYIPYVLVAVCVGSAIIGYNVLVRYVKPRTQNHSAECNSPRAAHPFTPPAATELS